MDFELTQEQKDRQRGFQLFSRTEIAPYADAFDRQEYTPPEVVQKLAAKGYLGSIIPARWGGLGLDMIAYGLLHEEVGQACSSVRSLITVHDMLAMAVISFGDERQQQRWLPKLATGAAVGAFAVTEPDVGSDVKSVRTTATRRPGGFLLDGEKKWITYGQVADVFLVLAQCNGKPTTFIVERSRPGFASTPIQGMLGQRASMLASLTFDNCEIPEENLLGRVGFGMLSAASVALGLGRYSVAWGAVGIAQACVDACLSYTDRRKQNGVYLRQHQLIQAMMTDMITNTKAARLLCLRAGYLKDAADPREVMETFVAKYFSSRAAMKAALDAVQIHGAAGCSSQHPVQRYLRDAKILEIIEGSNQIQQITIAGYGYQEDFQKANQPALANSPAPPQTGPQTGGGRHGTE
jgi:glutaryl-CoA dehydrogenase (non-decarboxylating)